MAEIYNRLTVELTYFEKEITIH